MEIKTFSYYNPIRTYVGAGALNELATMPLPGKKAYIMTTKGRRNVDRVVELLKQNNNTESFVFDQVRPDPECRMVDACAVQAKELGCDFVIGLGGGSPCDAAKGVAVAMENEPPIWDYVGYTTGKPFSKAAPVIAISTTNGTGTEADSFAVIMNDETKEKLDLWNDCIYPYASIVDPELMLTLTPFLTATTGFDAVMHAAEVYMHKDHNPFTDMVALEAMRFADKYLVRSYKDGSDLEARYGVALASNHAGRCMDQISTVSLHAMSHGFGGYHEGVPHGVCLAIVAPVLWRYYAQCWTRTAEFAEAMGLGKDPNAMVEWVDNLLKNIDLWDVDYKQYGISKDLCKDYAHTCFTSMIEYFEFEEVPMTEEVCADLYVKCLERLDALHGE